MKMSVHLEEHELSEAVAFLSKYLADHDGSDDTVLVRPNCYCMTKDEIEGEILDLVLTYLSKRSCSSALKSALAHEIALEILSKDISTFEQPDDVHLPTGGVAIKKYDAMAIAKATFHQLYLTCQKWAKEPPVLQKNKFSYDVSFDAIKNTRRKMEDKHFIMSDFNILHGLGSEYPSQSVFSVFDGHGGVDAACYAASQLHCHLKRFEKLATQPLEALRYAFTKTDAEFLQKAKRERLKSGSTAVTILIQNNALYVAWVGDSQVTLTKNGEAVKIMEPHKPEREDERRRIEELGGCVVWFGGWRVNGSLAVSRAIGDLEQKPFVSSDADILQYRLEGDEDYIILACDGLWDTVDAETATSLTEDFIRKGNDRRDCAKMLVTEAKSRGSMDNISVIVVFLDDHRKDVFNSIKGNTEKLESGASFPEEEEKEESTVNTKENENETIMTNETNSKIEAKS